MWTSKSHLGYKRKSYDLSEYGISERFQILVSEV